jgi:hypothetical protein
VSTATTPEPSPSTGSNTNLVNKLLRNHFT